MSFHSLLGAFAIAPSGDSLEPAANDAVGELRASSRGGAFTQTMGQLLDVLPGHEALRFLAREAGPLPQRHTDPQTHWTVLDGQAASALLSTLDSLLLACERRAEALADRVAFGSDVLGAAQLRQALRAAREVASPNTATPACEDGDTADFVFSVLISLRNLLRRAITQTARIAVFTWAPN